MFPRIGGGVLKYKETIDKTINVIQNDYTTLYDVYTANRPCIIKVNSEGGNINIALRVGNDVCATLSSTSVISSITKNAKHLIADTFYYSNAAASLIFLLDAGETLQFNSAAAGNTDPHIILKMHVYEWE